MIRYVKLVIAVTVAEFPSFDIFCAFQLFHLETRDALLAGAPTREARAFHAQGASTEQDRQLEKLAHFFRVDAAKLSQQYRELKVCAKQRKSVTDCDNPTAWREAVRRYSQRAARLQDGSRPYKEITHVLMRCICFSVSAAAVEQNFQVIKRCFGEQGLGAGNHTENRMVKLILSRHVPQEPDREINAKAQTILGEHCGVG